MKKGNSKVRTIDVDIRSHDRNLKKDPYNILHNKIGDQSSVGVTRRRQGSNVPTNASALATNEAMFNNQVSIINDSMTGLPIGQTNSTMPVSTKGYYQSTLTSNNEAAVKIVVHDLKPSMESPDQSSMENSIAMQQYQSAIIQPQYNKRPTQSKEYNLSQGNLSDVNYAGTPQIILVGQSALQQEAIRGVSQSVNQSGTGTQSMSKDTLDQKEKKRPRKRYYNGYGKVPYLAEPAVKDSNRKMSRILTGKTWGVNRKLTNQTSSNISNQSKYVGDDQKQAQSGRDPQAPYQSYAVDVEGKNEQSRIQFEDRRRNTTINSEIRDRNQLKNPILDIFNSNSRPSTKIQVNNTHVTLDPSLAVKLAQDGAVVGLTNAYNELKSLSKPIQNTSNNALLFTLDQYKWAQKQGVYEHRDSIGNNSLGRQILTSSANTKRGVRKTHMSQSNVMSSYDPTRPSQGDFMMEEAAISHLMHRADNMPKIKFQLASEQDQLSHGNLAFGAYNSVSRATIQAPYNRRNNPGAKSLSCVGVKPKILGSVNDLQEMSPIGKYLLHDEKRPEDRDPNEIPLDFIKPYPTNQFVNNLISNASNISVIDPGHNMQPKHQLAVRQNKSQQVGRRNIMSAVVGPDQKQLGVNYGSRKMDSVVQLTEEQIEDHNLNNNLNSSHNLPIPSELVDKTQYLALPEEEYANSSFAYRTTGRQMRNQASQPRVPIKIDHTDDSVNIGEPTEEPEQQLQPQSQPLRNEKYKYHPKHDELHDGDIVFSSGNIYHEQKNPAVAKLLSSVQNNIQQSHNNRFERRHGKEVIFGMMKKSVSCYNKTIEAGEEEGHCKGVNDKNASDRLYQNRLRTQRFLQKQEDRYEEIRAKRPAIEKARQDAQRKRTQEKILRIEQAKKIVPDLPRTGQNANGKNKHHNTNSSSDEESQGQLQVDRPAQSQAQNVLSPGETSVAQSIAQNKNPSNLSEGDFDRMNSGDTMSPTIKAKRVQIDPNAELGDDVVQDSSFGQKVDSLQKQNADLKNVEIQPQGRKSKLTVKTQSSFKVDQPDAHLLQLLNFQTSASKSNQSKAKKIMQKAQKKAKALRDALGLKNISTEQVKIFEQIFMGRSINQSPMLVSSPGASSHSHLIKVIKLFQSESFITYKQSHNKPPGIVLKRNKIFTKTEQLGLEERPDFQAFFLPLCEDKSNYNPKLQRLKYKQFLQDRYSEIVGEKVLLFLENKFQTLFTFDKKGYCNVLMEFLNQGPDLYKKLLFNCLSQANPGYICEHDIFQLIECFKQRDSYFFYKELITGQDVPRDFSELRDDSDEIFFEAFATDVRAIAKALNLKKRMHGIQDTDTNLTYKDDINEANYPSREDFEEDVINQIDYLIGVISSHSPKHHEEIANILIQESEFIEIRNQLIELTVRNDLCTKGGKKGEGTSQGNHQTTSNQKSCQLPCLGSAIVTDTGKKIQTDCCYLSFEDFNKLVIFKKGRHSGFVEDLVDHMSNSLISLHDVENWCSHLREYSCKATFPGKNLIDYVAAMNIKEYGNSRGNPPLQALVKKQRLGIVASLQPHTITTPYTLQDHYSGEDYMGKLIIRKIPKNASHLDQKEGLGEPAELQANDSPEHSEEEEFVPQDGDECSPTGPGKTPMVLNTFLVTDDNVYKLIEHRAYFGLPNFFRIFRIFYQLATVPEDAQNNPFALVLDQQSMVKNFSSIFKVDNEEVAVRFFKLFIAPLGEPKAYKIDIMRWFFVIQNLCDNADPKKNHNYLNLAFNFLDYDQNGSIGSVDILNLKKSVETAESEKVISTFMKQSLGKQFQSKLGKLQANVAAGIVNKKNKKSSKQVMRMPTQIKSILEKPNRSISPQRSTKHRPKKVTVVVDEKNREDSIETSSSEDSIISACLEIQNDNCGISGEVYQTEEQKILHDPWNHFIMEVMTLRDFYVNEAVRSQNPRTTDYKFFTQKVYDLKFLQHLESKFEVKSPTIVHFFKHVLCYEFHLDHDLKKEKGDLFTGFTKRGHRFPVEAEITDELISMQKMLMEMSNVPKPALSAEGF